MRAFVAVLPEPDFKEAVWDAGRRLEAVALRGHFTARENLHLTLAFLGEIEDPACVETAMRETAGSSFILSAGTCGRFPRRGGDVLWLGVRPSAALGALQQRLCARLRAAGFALEDRAYTPHITLGRRVVLPPAFDLETMEPPAVSQRADAIWLMESTRVDGRLRYLPRVSIRLEQEEM